MVDKKLWLNFFLSSSANHLERLMVAAKTFVLHRQLNFRESTK
jgi:hypothetical protein